MTHYYYSPTKGYLTEKTNPSNSDGIELTRAEFEAAKLILLHDGGYHAIASAMYKCGIPMPDMANPPDYAIGECWEPGCNNGEKPLKRFSYNQEWLCREHYQQAEAKLLAEQEAQEEKAE